jgi:hypothetical protein
MRRCGDDRGAISVPWYVKLAVTVGVLGVLGYDGFVTVATHLKAENTAQNAAYAASKAWTDAQGSSRSPSIAFQGAISYLAGEDPARCDSELTANSQLQAPGVIPLGCDYLCTGAVNQRAVCGTHGLFSVDDTGTVHLVIRRQASTLVFGHLGFMHNMLVAFEQGDANSSQD